MYYTTANNEPANAAKPSLPFFVVASGLGRPSAEKLVAVMAITVAQDLSRRPQRNAKGNEGTQKQRHGRRIVLLIKQILAAVEFVCHARRNKVTAFADMVRNDRIGAVNDAPIPRFVLGKGRMVRPPAQIHIFTVHKEVLIERADLFHQPPPNAQRRPAYPIHIARRQVVILLHQIIRREFVFGKEASKGRIAKETCAKIGVLAAGVLETAVRVEQFGSHDADVVRTVRELHQLCQRIGQNRRIRVQKENPPPRSLRNRDIVARAKAQIRRIDDQPHARKLCRDHFPAVVGAVVVHHDDFVLHRGLRSHQRSEGLLQQRGSVPIENDNG